MALEENEFRIANIDTTIICEQPKLSSFYGAMRDKLSSVLEISSELINVKATTMEGLGDIGQGKSVSVQAVALLYTKQDQV